MDESIEKMLKGILDAARAEQEEAVRQNNKQMKEAATGMKFLYDSFVDAGFNPSQALQLTCTMLTAAVGSTKKE